MKRVVYALLVLCVSLVAKAQVSESTYSSKKSVTTENLLHLTSENAGLDLETDYALDFEAADTGRVLWSHLKQFFHAPYDGVQGFPDDGIGGYNEFTTKGRVYVREYDGNKVLRMEVDKGNVGGPFILSTIPGKNTELYQSFNMRLKPRTNFAMGGKYMGVRTWTWPHEFKVPHDGFNNAIQFKADSLFAGSANLAYAEALSHYLTYPNMPCDDPNANVYGRSYGFPDTLGGKNAYFKIPNNGEWFNVTTRYVLNDLGKSNGFIEVWINNKFSHRWGGLVLRTTDQTFIDINRISFYYGGNTPEQAAREDSWVEYDDICYFTYGDSYTDVPKGTETSEYQRVLDLPNWPKDGNGADDDLRDLVKPSVPQNLKSTAVSNNSVSLSWDKSSDNKGIKSYRVYVNGSRKATVTSTSVTIDELNQNTEYSFEVSAVDDSYNESAKSAVLRITTSSVDSNPPSAPTGLIATNIGENSIDISWNKSTDNMGVKEYKVYLNGSVVKIVTPLSTTLTDLNPGSNYKIKITALDLAGNESQPSAELSVNTLAVDTERPTVPGKCSVPDITRTSVTLAWEKSTDNIGVSKYNIYVDNTLHGSTEYAQFTVDGLEPATVYTFEVTAVDYSKNESGRNEAIKVITDAPDLTAPGAPKELSLVNVETNIVDLAWSHSEDNDKVLGYYIYANGLRKGNTTNNFYSLSQLNPSTSYDITVTAFDPSGNESLHSQILEVTTESEDKGKDNMEGGLDEEMPEVSIIKVVNNENETETVTEVKSIGSSEVKEYGVRVAKDLNYSQDLKLFSATRDDYYVNNDGRISRNLQALYNFSSGNSNYVHDISGNAEPLDLLIENTEKTEWLSGQGIKINHSTLIATEEYPKRLVDSLKSTNEITVEAWVKTCSVDQDGPARIVTLSSDQFNRAFTLGQVSNDGQYNYVVRANTTNTDANGLPEGYPSISFDQSALHHLVYTRTASGKEIIYINGKKYYSAFRGGDFSSWDESVRFGLANEFTGDRPWLGSYYLVAVYNSALSQEEIMQNYMSGYGRVEFKTKFKGLNPNTTYYLSPFVTTQTGTNFGESVNIITPGTQLALEYDTLQMSIYPNPNNGDFNLFFEYTILDIEEAWMRVTDSYGRMVYYEDIELSRSFFRKEISINLSQKGLKDGVYMVSLMIGRKLITKKMMINRNY